MGELRIPLCCNLRAIGVIGIEKIAKINLSLPVFQSPTVFDH